jgi:putative membrane protein
VNVIAAVPPLDPWRFQPHPEVWLLVAFLIGAFAYCVRVIGPQAVRRGLITADQVMTRKQLWCFIGAMALLWVGSDWPIHDIGEQYLYSAHMLQHMMFTYFMPPLALLATPEWLLRTLVGQGRTYRIYRTLTRPLFAGLVFNAMVVVSHIPGVVNESVSIGALHYLMHLLLVSTALLMWTPVCGPFAELRMQPAPKMVYLFLMSVVPTIPAAWLTFAEGVVYSHYAQPVRVWGLTVGEDQQLAGATMKLGGTIFIWSIIVFIFFRRFDVGEEHGDQRSPLTYEEVAAEFDRSPALLEPEEATRD